MTNVHKGKETRTGIKKCVEQARENDKIENVENKIIIIIIIIKE
jgi:hypothetical protein